MQKEKARVQNSPPATTHAGYKRHKVYILHVEDDEIDAMLTRKAILRQVAEKMPEHDFHIDFVVSLIDALEKVNNKKYHVILLDLALTDVSGLSNVRALKSQAPGIPIIVLTGDMDPNKAVTAIEDGADDYIVKMQLGDPAFENAIKRAITSEKGGG